MPSVSEMYTKHFARQTSARIINFDYRRTPLSEEMLFSSVRDGAISFHRLMVTQSREELVDFAKHIESLVRGAASHAIWLLSVMTVALVTNFTANAEDASPQILEYRVKAGFLYTFAKYVEWPTGTFHSPTNAIVIGILGKDPFGKMLNDMVAGKAVDGRPIRIQRFQRAEEIQVCHILFVSASEKSRLPDIQTRLRGRSILTVSELDGFLEHDGQIRFVSEDNRVWFDIDMEATRQAGLTLDANLLRVARRVMRQEGGRQR